MIRLAHIKVNEDDAQMGRVQVEYVNHGSGSQSDWVSVATPFAGNEAGLFVMPELGDLVAIGFINGDLNQPIMLGAIWSGAQKAPSETPQDRRFVSRKGHSLTLSDGEADGITLEDAHENRIVMNKDGISIETKGTLTIKAAKTATVEASGEMTLLGKPIQLNP